MTKTNSLRRLQTRGERVPLTSSQFLKLSESIEGYNISKQQCGDIEKLLYIILSKSSSPCRFQFPVPPCQSTAREFTEDSLSEYFSGYFVSGQMQVLGQQAGANLWVTSSPMVVQSLGPVSPVTSQSYTSVPLVTHPQPPQGLVVPYTDTRSLFSRDSLASTTLSLAETHSVLSGRQEWPYGYRVLPPLCPQQGSTQVSKGGELLSLPPGTAMSGGTSISNSASLPSYLFGGDANSPRQYSAHSKKRALSISPLSDGYGLDFNSIIRTSPTSLVAYINGSRSSPTSHHTLSPLQPEVYGHFLGVRGSCIPYPQTPGLLSLTPSTLALTPLSDPQPELECGRMQRLEQGRTLESQMANMVHRHLQRPPSHIQGQPKSQGPVSQPPPAPPGHGTSLVPHPLSLFPMLEEGELEDYSGGHCCRWVGCSAVYNQKEELVRHIEKRHVDQRKGEDFTCFWAVCPRRFKPFNARYKLLIHMRVHSGEKPNKCTVHSKSISGEGLKTAFKHASVYLHCYEAVSKNAVLPDCICIRVFSVTSVLWHSQTISLQFWKRQSVFFPKLSIICIVEHLFVTKYLDKNGNVFHPKIKRAPPISKKLTNKYFVHDTSVCKLPTSTVYYKGTTEGCAYGPVHHGGQASCHPGPQ
ncbi:unnamed protein product [Oncorhynchus mykiss]|uniref:C2H2-type domain-containing protein n=1 Tax=Oncorhynchus mykiss TaxID=8022 RepID=A0A060XNH2_ONCMY|nr:unnamed protein product [Oncorhynchus mykiss]